MLTPDKAEPARKFALDPSLREQPCHHPHVPYEGQIPCTGLRRCSLCGTRFTEEEFEALEKKRRGE